MGINFPNAPTVGQLYPSPPQQGLPVYQWDGEKWTTGPPNIPDGLVHYDIAQSLTENSGTTLGQRGQARSNIAAAPIDALSYSGMQVNGSMEVSQERGSTAISGINPATAPDIYIVDGWHLQNNGSQIMTALQTATAPPGLVNSIQAYATTANASPAAANYCLYVQNIEGFRTSRLGWGTASAQPITLGFWVISTVTGLFSGYIRNNAFDRCYVFTYTINNAGPWEFKTITIPGDVTGTWVKDNTAGLRLGFCLMSGSTGLTATTGTWLAGSFFGATGTMNVIKTTSDYMLLTGVVVLPGLEAPSAAQSPLIMRPFDQELLTCQRYLRRFVFGQGVTYASTTARYTYTFAPMRTTPTQSMIGALTIGDGTANYQQSAAAVAAVAVSTEGIIVDYPNFTGMTGPRASFMTGTTGTLQLDARL